METLRMPDAPSFRALAEGVVADGDHPHLIAGRDSRTSRLTFPWRPGKDQVAVASEGLLWSWTVQRFRPKSPPYAGPEAFEPFAVGYVAFADQLIVEGRLANVDFDAISIGMPMRTIVVPFATEADGSVITTYAFEPVMEPR